MKKIIIDPANIATVKALYIYMAYMLDLPAYYGNNLDALHDVLAEIGEKTHIVLLTGHAAGECAAYMPRLARVMEDAAQENPCLTVDIAA